MRRPIAYAVFAALALVAGLVPAQQEDGVRDGMFVETIDVNVINVEVFVTDKRGAPVRGLTKDDFVLYEDKREMPITNFYAVEEGRPVAGVDLEVVSAGTGDAEEETAGDQTASAEDVPIPEDQRLHLVVYIDNFNIRPFNRNRVFGRLRQFLSEELEPEDRVMLVSYDRSLNRRHPFTSDPQLIAQQLFELETLTGHAIHQDSDRRELLSAINEAESLGQVYWRVRTFAESTYNDLSFSISAMREMVDGLAGLPGRKALLYVSDGLSMRPGDELFNVLLQRFNDTTVMSAAMEFDASRQFEQLASQANTNRVTFYTIDAAGLRPPSASSVEMAQASAVGTTSFYDQTLISNLQEPLRLLAERTGGRAILNTNDVGPSLAKVALDFDTYYSLGFTPGHSGSGRLYDIKVEVRGRKDLDVRHRTSYRDKPISARIADSTMATLLYGSRQNTMDIGLAVEQTAPDQENDKYYLVTITVEIPINRMTFIPREDQHVGRAKVFFVAMDEEGGTSEVQEVPLELKIPAERLEEAQGQLYPYEVQLRMRPGPHRLAVGVLDELGAEAAYVSKSFVVGSA